jgi:ribosomal protein L15
VKDYIRKTIFNDTIKPGDVMRGKTGFEFWDNLTDEERKQVRQQYLAELETMSPQEKAKMVDDLQTAIREKQRENGGKLMKASSYDVLREMMNVDLQKDREAAAQEVEKYGYLELGQHIRRYKVGYETININIVDKAGNVVDKIIL